MLFWHSRCIFVVMSKDKKDLVDSSENDKLGPDYFGYYTRLVTDLLSKEEDFPPFASQSSGLSQSRGVEVRGKDTIEHSYGIPGSLFGNSIGTGLSDFKKERLKSLLRQGVKVLSPEVDEMLGPVIGISQLKSQLKRKQCLARGALPDVHVRNTPSKRLKKSSSFSSTSLPALSTPTNPESSREVIILFVALSLLSNIRFSILVFFCVAKLSFAVTGFCSNPCYVEIDSCIFLMLFRTVLMATQQKQLGL